MRIKSNTLLFLALLMIGASSCKKSDSNAYKCANCATSPNAVAANDQSSKGVYKGTIVGSTGSVMVDILNSGSNMTIAIKLDDQWINMGTTATWTAGQPFSASFEGVYNGQSATLTFSVNADGSNPTVTNINIPGHTSATIVVYKELSTSQVFCYEGTFSGSNSGAFNMIINSHANTWVTIAKDNNNATATLVSGTVSGTSVSCTNCIGSGGAGSVSGTISGDNINGSWNDGHGGSGSWTCHKTL